MSFFAPTHRSPLCPQPPVRHRTKAIGHQHPGTTDPHPQPELTEGGVEMLRQGQLSMCSGGLVVETTGALCQGNNMDNLPIYVYQIIMEGNHEINYSMIVGCQRCNGDVRSHAGTQSYHLSDLLCEEPNGLG